jgi:phage repressor protein C with HTH and peptisase S24 domain
LYSYSVTFSYFVGLVNCFFHNVGNNMEIQPYRRLAAARKKLGLTLEGFATPLGVSNQAVSKWERGLASISLVVAQSIEVNHGISCDWLLNGAGDAFSSNVGTKVGDIETQEVRFSAVSVPLPLVSLRPSAGLGADTYSEPDVIAHLPFDREWLHRRVGVSPRHLFLAEVDGDSMTPTLHPNDLVMVDKSAPTKGFRDGIWVFRNDNAILVKRIQCLGCGQYRATSDNQGYSPITFDEDFHLIGRVVWSDKLW